MTPYSTEAALHSVLSTQSSALANARIRLKSPCCVLEEPVTGLHYRVSQDGLELKPGKLGTLFPSAESATEFAARELAGIPHQLARIDQ